MINPLKRYLFRSFLLKFFKKSTISWSKYLKTFPKIHDAFLAQSDFEDNSLLGGEIVLICGKRLSFDKFDIEPENDSDSFNKNEKIFFNKDVNFIWIRLFDPYSLYRDNAFIVKSFDKISQLRCSSLRHHKLSISPTSWIAYLKDADD